MYEEESLAASIQSVVPCNVIAHSRGIAEPPKKVLYRTYFKGLNTQYTFTVDKCAE